MEIDVSDLLVRYLQRGSRDSLQYRVVLTTAIFREHDFRVREVIETGGQLDLDLVTEIAALASPIELAALLANWGDFLPAESFEGTSLERCGATHEILVLVDDPAHRFLSSLPHNTVLELGEKLKAASQNDVDVCTRENATNSHRLLCDFISNGG